MITSSPGSESCRVRSRWLMRRARRGLGCIGRWGRRGCGAWWPRRRRCSDQRVIGSNRREGRDPSGPAAETGRGHAGEGAQRGSGSRAGPGPGPRRLPGRLDAGPAPTVEPAAAPRDHLLRWSGLDRRPRHMVATPTSGGCWSRPPGTTVPATYHCARYVVGKTMRDRWELAPPAARARGDAGNRRLHHRWITFNLSFRCASPWEQRWWYPLCWPLPPTSSAPPSASSSAPPWSSVIGAWAAPLAYAAASRWLVDSRFVA